MLGILFSLSVAADEIQHSPTSKELEIPFPWKGNYRCRYFTMGQHESQQLRNPKSHEKFQGVILYLISLHIRYILN